MAIIIKYVTTQGTTTPPPSPLLAVFLTLLLTNYGYMILREDAVESRPRRYDAKVHDDEINSSLVVSCGRHGIIVLA